MSSLFVGPPATGQALAARTNRQVPRHHQARAGQGVWCHQPRHLSPRVWTLSPLPQSSPWLSQAPCSHTPRWFSVIPISQTGKPRPRERQQLVWVTQYKQRQSESLGPRPQTPLCPAAERGHLGDTALGRATCGPPGAKNIPDACGLGCVYTVLDPSTASSEWTASHLIGVAASWERGVWSGSVCGVWGLLRAFLIPASARASGVCCHGVWKATVATGCVLISRRRARPRCPRVQSPNTSLGVALEVFSDMINT